MWQNTSRNQKNIHNSTNENTNVTIHVTAHHFPSMKPQWNSIRITQIDVAKSKAHYDDLQEYLESFLSTISTPFYTIFIHSVYSIPAEQQYIWKSFPKIHNGMPNWAGTISLQGKQEDRRHVGKDRNGVWNELAVDVIAADPKLHSEPLLNFCY